MSARGPLTLTVLGCAGSSYDADLSHPCSSYLLETQEAAVMLDCGFGSFASYLENAFTSRLDAIVVSHAHGDHSFDLEAFLTFPSAWRDVPRVLASQATLVASSQLEVANAEVIVVDDGSDVVLDTFRVECSRTTHQMPTLATQISMNGRRVVYSADTGPGWHVPPSFRGPDLAILECTIETRDGDSSPFHLDSEEVAALAQSLEAQRTLLTHLPVHADGSARLVRAMGAAPRRDFLLAVTGQRHVIEPPFEADGYR
ncbi:MAG: MBL fold metallo-hydrolase [Acidimicrobiales bacterium]